MRLSFMVLALLLVALLVSCSATEQIRVETEEVATQLIHQPKREAGELTIENGYSEHELYHIQYPLFQKEGIDGAIKQYLDDIREEFRFLGEQPGKRQHELHVDYQSKAFDPYVTVEFLVFMNVDGLAHPLTSLRVITLDVDQDKVLTLDELVDPEEKKNIVEHLKNEIEQSDGDYYDDLDFETIPLENISYDGEELSIFFNPYEIAPYYMGIQRFNLTGSDFKQTVSQVEPVLTPVEAPPETTEAEGPEFVGPIPSPTERELDPDRPAIALTFDDGPGNFTEELLGLLESYGGRGSFFVLGVQIPGREEILRHMTEQGHLIGNHTYNHRELTKLSSEEIREQLSITDDLIEQVTGMRTRLMRPTYGSWDEYVAQATDKPLILWSVDTNDWKHRDASHLTQFMLDHVYDGAIVLMHDIHESTLEGVRDALPTLVERGYQLVTVEELARLKGRSLEPHTAYGDIQ